MESRNQKPFTFSALPAQVKIAGAGLLLMAVSVCKTLIPVWSKRQDYSFGYLTPLFVLYVLFDRKEKIAEFFEKRREKSAPIGAVSLAADFAFGGMFACGIATFLAFAFLFFLTQNRGVPAFTMTFALSFTIFASAYLLSGKDNSGMRPKTSERLAFVSLFVFPSFIWLIAAPLFRVVESRVSLFLLSVVAKVVFDIMTGLGFAAELHGNTIQFPSGSIGVADACSGIRSLTACLFAGSFLAAVFFEKTWKKITLVVSSMALAFFFNLCRALFLAFWAYQNGPDTIGGAVHDAAGYVILGCTVAGLLLIGKILNINPVPEEFRNGEKNGKAQ